MYKMIFKRKSFHLFRDYKTKVPYCKSNKISLEELKIIEKKFLQFNPLYKDIKVQIKIVSNEKTNCTRDQEYCILFYSEMKDNYLQNIGYLGEKLDLFLVSMNIGVLWYGIGKTTEKELNGLSFVTMMAISKVPENLFRKDMFKSKRKPLSEIYIGNKYKDIINIARFSPSSCNLQPWLVKDTDKGFDVYRYHKEGKRGIIPINKVIYQNLIDIGIFICFIELCLEENKREFNFKLLNDYIVNTNELTKICVVTVND